MVVSKDKWVGGRIGGEYKWNSYDEGWERERPRDKYGPTLWTVQVKVDSTLPLMGKRSQGLTGEEQWGGREMISHVAKHKKGVSNVTFKHKQWSFLSKFFILNKTIFLNVVWKILANVANLRKSIASVICCCPDVIDSKWVFLFVKYY